MYSVVAKVWQVAGRSGILTLRRPKALDGGQAAAGAMRGVAPTGTGRLSSCSCDPEASLVSQELALGSEGQTVPQTLLFKTMILKKNK